MIWIIFHIIINHVLLKAKYRIEYIKLAEVCAGLIMQHDQLRARFIRDNGKWRQMITDVSQAENSFRINIIEMLDEPYLPNVIQRQANKTQQSLDIKCGVQTLIFDLYYFNDSTYLFISAHHLVIDTISWTIILDDLDQLLDHENPSAINSLPSKTTSYQAWQNKLHDSASSQTMLSDSDFWVAQLSSIQKFNDKLNDFFQPGAI